MTSSDLTKHAVADLPPGEPAKVFDYDGQKIFNEQAKLKDQKAFKDAGDYLQTNKFGLAVVAVSVGMKGETDQDQVLSQGRAAVIRDYLQAWSTLATAFDQNRSNLLDRSFTGTAREKLADTILQQAKLGIYTRYRASAHDLQLVFYSPEGLSIQLVDTVEYDVQILDGKKAQATQHVRARYVAVLTPTEVRWRHDPSAL